MSKTEKMFSVFVLAAASVALSIAVAGCNSQPAQDNTAQNQTAQPAADQAQDPGADANLAVADAPPDNTAANSAPPPSNPAPRPQAAPPPSNGQAPPNYSADDSGNYGNDNSGDYGDDYYADDEDSSYGQPVIYASQPPPPLAEYSQPDIPGDGYLWTPGYWSYAPQGY
jgi:hypothetical protein